MQDLRLPRKEPRAEALARLVVRVFRIPIAAQPLLDSLLPWEGGGCEADGG